MPKRVDHQAWRARVADAAADLIAEEGLPAMTFRRLAERLGCSTTVISHYFASRAALLEAVYASTNEEAALVGATSHPARTPIDTIADLLPVSRRRIRTWRIWLNFWNSALVDSDLRETHRRGLAGTRRMLRIHLVELGQTQDDAARGSEEIMQAIFGIAMQALFDPDHWYPGRQLAAFRRAVAQVLSHAARPIPILDDPALAEPG